MMGWILTDSIVWSKTKLTPSKENLIDFDGDKNSTKKKEDSMNRIVKKLV